MPRYNDPTVLHSAECPHCGNHYADNECDIAPSGLCWTCEDEHANDEDALSEDDVPALRADWFSVAKAITIPGRGA